MNRPVKRILAVCTLAATIAMLGGCSDDSSDSGGSTTAATSSLDGTSWTIVSLDTADGTQTAPDGATLAFESGGQMSVDSTCNTAFGAATVSGDTITMGPLGGTLKACEPPLDTWEQALFGFLDGDVGFEVSGDELTLTNGDSTLHLTAA